MKKTKRNAGIILSVGLLTAGILVGGVSFANQRQGLQKPFETATTYNEFIEQTKGTRLEGKISEEKFNEMKQKHDERQERREKLDAVIQSHDFSAWKKLMTEENENSSHQKRNTRKNELLEKIDTQEKFEKFIEMHSIMQEAKTKVEAIREELGLEKPTERGFMKGGMEGNMKGKRGGHMMRGERGIGSKIENKMRNKIKNNSSNK